MPPDEPPNLTVAIQDLDKDLKTLYRFMLIYCQGNHGVKQGFCPECQDLLAYAQQRRQLCPLDPKPACKNCSIHCYKPEYREKIRQVMRYSGKRFYKIYGVKI
jgi:predicted amidophosphoribosyltransferase